MTRHGDSSARQFAALVPDDDPADLVALVRLQVLNTVLLAAALDGRGLAHIAYETAVTTPGDALATLTAAVPELCGLALAGETLLDRQGSRPAGDDTFATTTRKTMLVAGLEKPDAELVRATTAWCLGVTQALVPAPVAERAASWLAGDHLYLLDRPRRRAPAATGDLPALPPPAAPRYLRRGKLEVRNVLVSNAEYARFLNALAGAGTLEQSRRHLPAGVRDAARARRAAPPEPRYRIGGPSAQDMRHHPAYWVTWIGAAAFAAWNGARLPCPRRADPADPGRAP